MKNTQTITGLDLTEDGAEESHTHYVVVSRYSDPQSTYPDIDIPLTEQRAYIVFDLIAEAIVESRMIVIDHAGVVRSSIFNAIPRIFIRSADVACVSLGEK